MFVAMIKKVTFVNVRSDEGVTIEASPTVESPTDRATEARLSVYVIAMSNQAGSKTLVITGDRYVGQTSPGL
jgi:hypothetical protein